MAGVVALMALSACGAVEIDVPDMTQAQQRACRSLVEDLPHRLSEQPRRDTEGSPLGAAWGDPAVVLRCGVGKPAGYDEFPTCQRVDGVDWYVPEEVMTDQDKDAVMTTIGRRPAIEVVVPAELRPPDDVLVDLAPLVKKHTEAIDECD